MRTLHIVIKSKYFNEILSGTKKEEYRLTSDHWIKRLLYREYDRIIFQNGYSKNAPRFVTEYKGCEIKSINHPFFGPKTVEVFAIKIGEIVHGEIYPETTRSPIYG